MLLLMAMDETKVQEERENLLEHSSRLCISSLTQCISSLTQCCCLCCCIVVPLIWRELRLNYRIGENISWWISNIFIFLQIPHDIYLQISPNISLQISSNIYCSNKYIFHPCRHTTPLWWVHLTNA